MAEQTSLPAPNRDHHEQTTLGSAVLRPSIFEDREGMVPPEVSSHEIEIAQLAIFVDSAINVQEFETIAQQAESLAPFPPNSRAYKLLAHALDKRVASFCDDVDGFLSGRLDAVFARIIQAAGLAKSKSLVLLIRKLCEAEMHAAASRLIDTLLRLAPLAQGYFTLTFLVRDDAMREKLQEDHFARLRELALTDESAHQQLVLSLQRAGRIADSTAPSSDGTPADQSKGAGASADGATLAAGNGTQAAPDDSRPLPAENPEAEQLPAPEQAAEPIVPELETDSHTLSAHSAEAASHRDKGIRKVPDESKPTDIGFAEMAVSDEQAFNPLGQPVETAPESSLQNASQSFPVLDKSLVTHAPAQAEGVNLISASPHVEGAESVETLSSEQQRAAMEARLQEAENAFFENRFDAAEALAKSALAEGMELANPERMRLHNVIARCRIARGEGMRAIDAIKARANDCRSERQADDLAVQSLLAGGELEHAFLAYWADGITSELRACGLRSAGLQSLRRARSSGQKIKGTCGIVCTDGLGGEFRMMQMLPDIARLFEKLVVICDARAVETFQRNFPEALFHGRDAREPTQELSADYAHFLDRKGMQKLRQCDYVADLNQFAAIVRPSVADFAGTPQLVEANPWLRVKWEIFLGMSRQLFPLIGLCWRQQSDGIDAPLRQSHLSEWLKAFQNINVRIVPLQAGLREDEMVMLRNYPHVVRMPEDFHMGADIEDTLALMSALPLIVSVPGTIQDMAGASGLRTLCPAHSFDAFWRRRPGSFHDLWSSSTIIIGGAPDRGLAGSITRTAMVLADAIGR